MINKDYMIHVDMYVNECKAEFYINDIPVKRLDADRREFESLVAHHYLKDGENEFKILINPGETPSSAQILSDKESELLHSGSPKALVRIVKYPVGAFMGDDDGEILFQLNWEYSEKEHCDHSFPMQFTDIFDYKSEFGIWTWEKVQPISKDEIDEKLAETIHSLYNSFISGDADPLLRFMQPFLKDYGTALSAIGTKRLTQNISNDIRSNSNIKDKASPFNYAETDFRLCGNGTLVEIVNKDWTPTLHIEDPENGSYYLRLVVAKLDNEWVCVFV